MLIGIDVGGTFTDAVLLDSTTGQLVNTVKVPTNRQDLLKSLEGALDGILANTNPSKIRRVNLSTTIVTNLIAEKKFSPVGLILIPGPGAVPPPVKFAAHTVVIKGATDHRGRITGKIDPAEVETAVQDMAAEGIAKVAVVGKFSVHNQAQEHEVAKLIASRFPDWEIALGHRCGPVLNFPRRAVNTVLTAATRSAYTDFARAVEEALIRREIEAPVMVLKADGGTLPLKESTLSPVETIFSGPAASVLGALSITHASETGVVVDIGGTTTDLALVLSGKPLQAGKGITVDGNLTQVRSFAITALPIGGDSWVNIDEDGLTVGPERLGPAACMGGTAPTPTDALRVLGKISVGDETAARLALRPLANIMCLTIEETAERIVNTVCRQISLGIEQMFEAWQAEPAYRLWELRQRIARRPATIIGVGGGAAGLVEPVAAQLDCRAVLPPNREVANAIGAAVARPTVRISLRADTDRGLYSVEEDGAQGALSQKQAHEIIGLGRELLKQRAVLLGTRAEPEEAETVVHEVFNIVRGAMTVGLIHHLILETPWQISHFVGGEQV